MPSVWSIIVDVAVVFAPITGFAMQAVEMHNRRSSAGFNAVVSFVSIVSNALRLCFAVGRDIGTPLVAQSAVMLVAQLAVLRVFCWHRPPRSSAADDDAVDAPASSPSPSPSASASTSSYTSASSVSSQPPTPAASPPPSGVVGDDSAARNDGIVPSKAVSITARPPHGDSNNANDDDEEEGGNLKRATSTAARGADSRVELVVEASQSKSGALPGLGIEEASASANSAGGMMTMTPPRRRANCLVGFWDWDNFFYYVAFTVCFGLVSFLITLVLRNSRIAIEVIGYISLCTESLLGLPQVTHTWRIRSAKGLSKWLVLSWLIGDALKTVYFIVRDSPTQFLVCGIIQSTIDSVLLLLFVYFTFCVRVKRPAVSSSI